MDLYHTKLATESLPDAKRDFYERHVDVSQVDTKLATKIMVLDGPPLRVHWRFDSPRKATTKAVQDPVPFDVVLETSPKGSKSSSLVT